MWANEGSGGQFRRLNHLDIGPGEFGQGGIAATVQIDGAAGIFDNEGRKALPPAIQRRPGDTEIARQPAAEQPVEPAFAQISGKHGATDRKRVVEGTCVSLRVDLGCRRIITKKRYIITPKNL